MSGASETPVATVHLPTNLRPLAGGRDRVEAPGATLRQVFDALDARWPGLKQQIVEDGRIRPQLAVAVDGSVVDGGLVVAVDEDAEIFLIPAVGGGAPRDKLTAHTIGTPCGA